MKIIKNTACYSFLLCNIVNGSVIDYQNLTPKKQHLARDYQQEDLLTVGKTLLHAAQYKKAAEYLDAALIHNKESAEYNWCAGDAHLTLGNLQAGFEGFSYRWKFDPLYDFKPWHGENLQNKRVLVCGQWGFENTLLNLRFVKKLADMGAEVFITAPEEHHSLLYACPYIQRVFSDEDPLPDSDYIIPITALAKLFNTTIDTIESADQSLIASPDEYDSWDAIAPPNRFTIAVGLNNYDSVQIEQITAPCYNAMFFNLLHGHKRRWHPETTHCKTAVVQDYANLTGLLAHCNLFITNDTEYALIAGNLGIPTWFIASPITNWFWHTDRNDSPWYPSINIIRTDESTNKTVLQAVRHNLELIAHVYAMDVKAGRRNVR